MKRVLHWLAFVAVAAVVLALAGVVVLNSGWFQERVRRRVVTELENATGGRVEIGRIHFDAFRWRVRADAVTVRGTEGPDQQPLFRVESLDLDLKLESFWRRRVNLVRLRALRPEVRIRVLPDGSTNLPARRAGGRPFTDALLDLAVDHVEWNDGALWWNDQRYPIELAVSGLRATVGFDPAGRYAGRLDLRRIALPPQVRWPAVQRFSTRFNLLRDRIEIPEIEVATAASTLRAGATVANLAQPRWEFRYEATTSASELAAALPLEQLKAGQFRLKGSGSFDSANAAWSTQGNLSAERLAVAAPRVPLAPNRDRQGTDFRLQDVAVAGEYRWDPRGLTIESLRVSLLGGEWKGRFTAASGGARAEGHAAGIRIDQAAATATTPARPLAELGWIAVAEGDVQIATSWPPTAQSVTVRADLRWRPPETTANGTPVEGVWRGSYSAARSEVEAAEFRLATPASRLSAFGRTQAQAGSALQFQVETTQPEELTRAAAILTGEKIEIPVRVEGKAAARGSFTGTLEHPAIVASLDVTNFVHDGRRWDSLAGRVEWSRSRLRLTNGRLSRGKAVIGVNVSARLDGGKLAENAPFEAQVSIRDTEARDLAALAGAQVPLSGAVTGALKLAGTPKQPRAAGSVQIRRGALLDEPFDALRSGVTLESGEVRFHNLQLIKAKGSVSGTATYHIDTRAFRFNLRGERLTLADQQWLAAAVQKAAGTGSFELSGSGRLAAADSSIESLAVEGDLRLQQLTLEGRPLGEATAAVRMSGDRIQLELKSNVFGAAVTGAGEILSRDPFPVQGRAEFRNLDVAAALEMAGAVDPARRESMPRGTADGVLTFRGPGRAPRDWTAEGSLSRLQIEWPGSALTEPIRKLRNDGPIEWRVASRALTFNPWRLLGEGSDLRGSGSVDLRGPGALHLALQGGLNLAVLGSVRPGLTANGASRFDVQVRGTLGQPDVNGRLEIQNATLSSEDLPIGLDSVNGSVVFSRQRATVEKLAGKAGGGDVRVSGEADFSGPRLLYRLRVTTERVRLRYPPGMATVTDGVLTFSGTNQRSLLSGEIRLTRASTRSQVDLATILAALREPPRTPSGSDWLQGMQLNVGIVSTPDIEFDTALARFLQFDANLRLQGNALNPALVGRLNITQGEFEYQGTRYRINRGDITLANPFRIEPIVNLELETRVGGYDILLTLAGPLQKMNVSYRSDPPLPVNELITLLAVGRAPTTDPTLAAQQTSQARSLTQFGASSVVGQALARPVSGRLQRFFGVSRLKLDPEIGGPEGNPNARLTIEQQVGKDITFTYIYSVASAQQQVVRVEWAVNRQWSLIAVRDENGAFGVDFLYKKRYR